MASATEVPRVGVGVIVTRNEAATEILVGRRKGGAEPDTWALPGGKLEHGERFEDCAQRELMEETGLQIKNPHFVWACSTVFGGQQHWVTVFVQGTLSEEGAQPQLTEPDKCHEWTWVSYNEIPEPRFTPLDALIDSGFEPRADTSGMHVRLADVVVSESARSGHKTVFENASKLDDDEWETPALEIAPAVQPHGHQKTVSITSGHVMRGMMDGVLDVGPGEGRDGGGGGGGGIVLMGPTVEPAPRAVTRSR